MTPVNVLVLGPDGSGKSSLAISLAKNLGAQFRSIYLGLSEESWQVTWIGRLYTGFIDSPTRSKALKGMFFSLAYPIEVLARVGPHKFGASRLIIDRFPTYPLTSSRVLRWWLKRILPNVDLAIVLIGDTSIFHARRPEHSVQELVEEATKAELTVKALGVGRVVYIDSSAKSQSKVLSESIDAFWAATRGSDPSLEVSFRTRR